jgi:hypothetical protein
MKDTIYNLRYKEMSPRLAAQLYPFINAYRPHDPAPTRTELKERGLDRIEEESFWDEIEEQHEAMKEAEA